MIYKTIPLAPFEDATLTPICFTNEPDLKLPPRRAIIVCPGGGYSFLSSREAEPIAAQFLAAGFATFILRYTVKPHATDFAPLKQAALAIKHVREHAEEYHIDPNYVFISGFSAGGHLAASSGILWNHPEVKAVLGDAPEGIARPTGMVLSYPVITAGEWAHQGSIHNLCGKKDPTDAERAPFSLEKHVDATTPPAFLWHTFTDRTVPLQNSLLLAEAMTAAGVPFELHIYPKGVHGLSLCNELTMAGNPDQLAPHCEGWIQLAIAWMRDFDALH